MKYMGIRDFTGFVPDEVGGGNGVQPMIMAAETDIIVLDADLMGRAYPHVHFTPFRLVLCGLILSQMYQSLPGAFNVKGGLWPCAIADGIGNTVVRHGLASHRTVC